MNFRPLGYNQEDRSYKWLRDFIKAGFCKFQFSILFFLLVTKNVAEAEFKDSKYPLMAVFRYITSINPLLPWITLAHELETLGPRFILPLLCTDTQTFPGGKPDSLLCLKALASSDQGALSWQQGKLKTNSSQNKSSPFRRCSVTGRTRSLWKQKAGAAESRCICKTSLYKALRPLAEGRRSTLEMLNHWDWTLEGHSTPGLQTGP